MTAAMPPTSTGREPTPLWPHGAATSAPGRRPPTPLTTLIGRERELSTLSALIADDAVRCVTLTGPGGTGKTRLALALTALMTDSIPDGNWFVPLSAVTEAAHVPAAIAQVLDVSFGRDTPPLGALQVALRDSTALLVLDNFEQVIDAAPAIADLLAACPFLTVLVTSRIALRIRGEHQVQVPPLPLPERTAQLTAGELADNPTVALFVQHAKAVRPDFSLTERNAAAIAEIGHRLEGIPLAIELAAARSKLLPPEALLARLSHRLTVLTGGARDAPARQQTMRDTIAWSYDLLSADERLLFRRLGVCVGGCGLDAAEAIGNDEDGRLADVLALVESLLDQSLLRQEEGPDASPRIVMLETIREFSLECLAASGEETDARSRHATHFLVLAESLASRLGEAEQARTLGQMDVEYPNLRAALNWFLEQGDAASALRLSAALTGFWRSRGLLREGQSWLERALALPGEAPTALRAQVLNGYANVEADLGDYTHAQALYEESLALRRERGDRQGIADALGNLGLLASDQRDYGRARALLEQSLAIRRELDDPGRLALTLANLGVVTYSEGRLNEAVALLDEARVRFAGIGDQRRLAYALTHLGIVARRKGDLIASEAAHHDALAWYQACQNKPGAAGALNNLGRVALDQRDFARAQQRYEEALALQHEVGNELGVALVLANMATLAQEQGNFGRAVLLFQESLSLRWAKRDGAGTVDSMLGIADAAAAVGRSVLAARLLGAAQAVHATVASGAATELPAAEQRLSTLQAHLGEEQSTSAMAEGRALPPEIAVAEALAVMLPAGVPPVPADVAAADRRTSPLNVAGLTPREQDVLRLVATGKTNAEIGEALFISPYTAKTHVANVLGKLGVESRAAASVWAAQHGFI